MSQNRLNLNFKLETHEDRVNYVESYLNSISFTPTSDELDTISKYILWGKDIKTGLNGRQEGIELESKRKTWGTKKIESLDALIDTAGFSESLIKKPSSPPQRISREVFSRSKTRSSAPPHILKTFELLWRQIDETELLINFYDLAHGKRTTPPREKLLKRFSQPDITRIESRSKSLSQYTYIKLKHQLVAMRREQYTLKDEFLPPHQLNSITPTIDQSPITFGDEISILPVGLPKNSSQFYKKIFNKERFPEPTDFSESELRELSKILWTPAQSKRHFDFSNPDHLYELFKLWDEIQSAAEIPDIESSLPYFVQALNTYISLTNLDPLLTKLLHLKIKKTPNQEIVSIIKKEFGKTYQPNYISTLYCKKCLGGIAETAARHRKVLENLFFPENFKKCKDCGRTFLRDSYDFVRRSRSGDGFSPRCKRCEKIKRDRSK